MPDTKKWNPYAAAAEALQTRKRDIDEMTKEDEPKEKLRKADPDKSRDPHEEKELTKTTPRLRDYRIRKSIGGDSPAEVRLYELQEKRLKSYKKGTKKVPKSGPAKLHKGEAVLSKSQAKKYRSGKVKAAASALGAGKHKKPAKKGASVSFQPVYSAAEAARQAARLAEAEKKRKLQEAEDATYMNKKIRELNKRLAPKSEFDKVR